MKASKPRSLFILILSIYAVLLCSLRILFYHVIGRLTPAHVDDFAKRFALSVFKYVRSPYSIIDPYHFKPEKNKRYIVMSNHISNYDIPLSFLAFPSNLRMVAKKELFKIPIWGQAMKASGIVYLDRENKNEAKKALEEAKKRMEEGLMIWMAPEGTRSKTGELQPFKKGCFMLAYQTEAIIIPLTIIGTDKVLPAKTLDFHLHQKVYAVIGKPIDIKNYKIKDRKQLMEDAQQAIIDGKNFIPEEK